MNSKARLLCEVCGSSYVRPPSRAEGARFCSAECKSISERRKANKVCEVCGAPYYRRPSQADGSRFCSAKCRDSVFIGTAKTKPKPNLLYVCDANKWCSKCQEVKPKTEFHRDQSRRDGLRVYCKRCTLEGNADYQKTHKRIRVKKNNNSPRPTEDSEEDIAAKYGHAVLLALRDTEEE